jgi:hypothetical protein
VSDPKQRDLDSVGRTASWLRERSKDPDPIPLGRARDRQDRPAQGKPDETVAQLRPVESRDWHVHRQSDVFAEAVARAMQEQDEPDLVEVPSVLQNRHAFVSIAARFAGAIGVSALVALVFVAAFPASQNPADEDVLASLPALKSLRSSLLPAPQRKPDPSLVIRDSGGPVNQRLSLGVNVKSPDPDPGATVTIAEAPASAVIVPSSPAASTPQQQPQQPQPVASPGPTVAARAEPPVREINPNEVAGFVKRAQDLLATGDLQAARLLLLRAAQAHDARAALLLAKSYDPIVSKRLGMADAEPDLAQARNWYQKAEQWGASEARRELDALASYPR